MDPQKIYVGRDGEAYKPVDQLGSGAHGSVYLVEKHGKYYALKSTKFDENRRLVFDQELRAYLNIEKVRGREGCEFLSQLIESVRLLLGNHFSFAILFLFDMVLGIIGSPNLEKMELMQYIAGNFGVIVTLALPIDLGKWLQLTKSDSPNPSSYEPYISWNKQTHVLSNDMGEFWEDHIRLFSRQLCLGLQCLHNEVQMMHRDLKPANILLKPSRLWSEHRTRSTLLAWQPVIIDFGTTGDSMEHLTFAGTPSWMAPEVASNFHSSNRKHYQVSVDIYSLGATIFSIVTRKAWKFNHMRAWYTKDANGNRTELEQFLKTYNLTLTPLLIDLLCGMISDSDNRWSLERVLAHPWMRFSEQTAETVLSTREFLDSFSASFSQIESMKESSYHEYVHTLYTMFESTSTHYSALNTLAEVWNEGLDGEAYFDSSTRYKRLYLDPWINYLEFLLAVNIWNFSKCYEGSDIQYLLGLEVAAIATRNIRLLLPKTPAHSLWKTFILDFNKTLTILKGNRIEGLFEEEEAIVKILAGGAQLFQVPFPALMHSLCVVRYRKLEKQLALKLFNSDSLDDETTRGKPAQYAATLLELKMALQYVITTLSKAQAPMTSSTSGKVIVTAANTATSSSSQSQNFNLINCSLLLADINSAYEFLMKC